MIALGNDHAGVQLKSAVAEFLTSRNLPYTNFGTDDESSVDYPDFAQAIGEAISKGQADRGILICGTGIGISISANKMPGIRAALCGDTFSARMSREHNDANVLCLGARVIGTGLALDIVAAWLDTPFGGGRHQRRVDKIGALEGAPVR